MCIALLSTAHPRYKLILIDNRDEFLNRPTAQATWWPAPDSDVLGGRDLLRQEQGTWLGVSKSGKVAVLTNFREDTPSPTSPVSRGKLIRDFLTDRTGRRTDQYVEDVIREGKTATVGGFSLVCGKAGERLAVISNRSGLDDKSGGVQWIMGDAVMTVGLSNAAFGVPGWKKVESGETLMLQAIQESIHQNEDEDQLIQRFLTLLSIDTLPRHEDSEGGLGTYINQLRNTIFVPALGRKDVNTMPADDVAAAKKEERAAVFANGIGNRRPLGVSGLYGTHQQTVVLVSHSGLVRFFERTLSDDNSDPIPTGQGDVDISFQITDDGT